MAITITVAELAAAVRLGDSAEETAEDYPPTGLLNRSGRASTRQKLPKLARMKRSLGWRRKCSTSLLRARGAYANAMRNSGAARILMPYRIHRAGSTEDAIAVAQGAVGTLSLTPLSDVHG